MLRWGVLAFERKYTVRYIVSVGTNAGGVMPHIRLRAILSLLMLVGLGGCATIESRVVDSAKYTPDGIVYYVPRRPFVITVSTPATGPTTVVPTQGYAEPDMAQEFVLSQATNLVAKNEMNVTVGANGLLKTSATTSTSEVATTVEAVATTAGMVAGLAAPAVTPAAFNPQAQAAPPPPVAYGCPVATSSYQVLLYPGVDVSGAQTFCNVTVSWKPASRAGAFKPNKNIQTKDEAHSGLFYRHELPYLVTTTACADVANKPVACADPSAKTTTVNYVALTSPDESEIDFFSIKRSFFANNTANITITDGAITAVDQTTEGEVTAAAALPADVLNSYTTALGGVFNTFTAIGGDRQKLLAQQQATALAQTQLSVCQRTIVANPLAGLNAAQLAAAQTAIKAACGTG